MKQMTGNGVVEGVALANAMTLEENFEAALSRYSAGDQNEEWSRYKGAVEQSVAAIEAQIANAKVQAEADVLQAHVLMVTDVTLEDAVKSRIDAGEKAPEAMRLASVEMAEMLASIDDDYLRERSHDVLDVGRRVMRVLLNMEAPQIDRGYHVLCGMDIEPSMVANMDRTHVAALILGLGSTTSHAVIIAKSKGIPTVVGLGDEIQMITSNMEVYVDGKKGIVILEPDDAVKIDFIKASAEEAEREKLYERIKDLPAETANGMRVPLAINVGNPEDIKAMKAYGAEGVGLFRTEFVFMGRNSAPDEETQFEAYKYVAAQAEGNLCVIRTLDIGGDKPADYLEIGHEDNPFLGWRALRICLDKPELFKTQIKAILRASHYGKVAIMMPMVISVDEVLTAKSYIQEVKAELVAQNISFDTEVEIGIMIETPAAVLMAPQLARHVDFFSIGTNDLTQYTLAVDRGNPKIKKLYDAFNPAVLKAIHMVVKAAHDSGIWVGMCGEMAGDPMALPILLAMGFDELSMSAPSVPKIKHLLRSLEPDQKLLDDVLACERTSDVRTLIQHYLER